MFAAGITLFCFGLFKKVVLADGMAEYVSPIFTFAEAGQPVSLLQGWLASVGFTLQIYFDFSGYSDMACGSALFFGVRLPLNFDSPLKASNIIDFWLRWHITLTRFLTAYIYNPIALDAYTAPSCERAANVGRARFERVARFLAYSLGRPWLLCFCQACGTEQVTLSFSGACCMGSISLLITLGANTGPDRSETKTSTHRLRQLWDSR